MNRILVLSSENLSQALSMPAAISAMDEAFHLPANDPQIPVRAQIPLKENNAIFLVMPAAAQSMKVLGAKLVAVFPENYRIGLESIQACFILVSATDGKPLALMDGKYLTAVRTAATSALATRFLAREVPSRLALFGTGTQARFHLQAISHVREILEARVCGSHPEKSSDFVGEICTGYPFRILPASPEDAVREADIICTCTTSATPVFKGSGLRPGVHINAVGAFQPHTRELDDFAIERSRIVVDTMEGAMAEAGDLLIPLHSGILRQEQIVADLSQIVRGEARGRSSNEDVTVFKSVGFALEDLVAALRAYENARKLGLGQEVGL